MRRATTALFLNILPILVAPNNKPCRDQLGIDDRLEIVHLYRYRWPLGIAVSTSGRIFLSFPAVFDELNTDKGSNTVFQVGELTGFDKETAYPNATYNNPPGGCVDFTEPYPRTKGLSNYLLSVPTVAVDQFDVLFLLDCGRCIYNGVLLDSSPGGPKLVSVDLNTDTVNRTYTFPVDVVTPTSFLGDLEFDRQGYAYISDSSTTGNNAICVLSLDTGDSYRVLVRDFSVLAQPQIVPFIYGEPEYQVQRSSSGKIVGFEYLTVGVNALTYASELDTLYFSGGAIRYLFSVPTDLLRNRSTPATELASAVRVLTSQGIVASIGVGNFGHVYQGNAEHDSIVVYDLKTGFTTTFVRDKRINFVGRLDIADNIGYLYFTVNQLQRLPSRYGGGEEFGTDRRGKPFALFRIPLLNSTRPSAGL